MQRLFLLGKDVLIGCPQKKVCDFEDVALEKVAVGIIMRCDSDSGKKLIKSMVLRTADRQGMC